MTTITTCQSEIFEQLRDALIKHRSIVAAGSMADCAGEPTLADTSWTDEHEIIVRVDPGTLGKLLEERSIETTRTTIIYIFDAGLLTQFGMTQSGGKPLVMSP